MLKMGELKVPAINVNDSVTKVPKIFTIQMAIAQWLLLSVIKKINQSSSLVIIHDFHNEKYT